MNEFLDPMEPEQLELIRQESDAPTLIFIGLFLFITWLCAVVVDPFEKDDPVSYAHYSLENYFLSTE